ncbi:MAG: glutamine-hydrolyzing GMP synthase [Oligoflexales bacterium]|nr:glutamine-hydrolyzing GMP synthase [Oligoflexales bacterium]
MTTENRPVNEGILVLDYGSQYTLLIARRLRESGIYAEIMDGTGKSPPDGFHFKGIILSGGPDSTWEKSSRQLPGWVIGSEKPILGICYGMQLLAEKFGGMVRSGHIREYGKSVIKIIGDVKTPGSLVFNDIPESQTVWMSHGDDVSNISDSFITLAASGGGAISAISHIEKPYIGLQFHPEVHHTEYGIRILENFAKKICLAGANWLPSSMLDATIRGLESTVEEDSRVLMAISGGVDSTVAITLLARALGTSRVTGVMVDNGLLRKDEAFKVEERLRAIGIKDLSVLKKGEEFLLALKGIVDPEEKRKIIGRKFISIFEEFASSRGGFTHLGQGTLYPDVIESASHGSGSKVIKSHHNVGGLPERLNLKLLEPFRYLFKDEVRKIGEQLGLPDDLVHRHPFPGPGLGVRILGEITADKIRILQEADHIYINKLKEENLYHHAWQAFAVLLPVKSVGVMGDNRTYQWTLALRAVTATDGMTAGVSNLPMDFLVSVSDEIVRKVDGINRVVYDITTKPPATIEWE